MTGFAKRETLEAARQLLEANGYTVTRDDLVTLTIDGMFDPMLIGDKTRVCKQMSNRMGMALFDRVQWVERPVDRNRTRVTASLTIASPPQTNAEVTKQ